MQKKSKYVLEFSVLTTRAGSRILVCTDKFGNRHYLEESSFTKLVEAMKERGCN